MRSLICRKKPDKCHQIIWLKSYVAVILIANFVLVKYFNSENTKLIWKA